jgi:hypothetical protein
MLSLRCRTVIALLFTETGLSHLSCFLGLKDEHYARAGSLELSGKGKSAEPTI